MELKNIHAKPSPCGEGKPRGSKKILGKQAVELNADEEQKTPGIREYVRINNEQKLARVDENGKLVYDDPGTWKCRKCGGSFSTKNNPPIVCGCCERVTDCDLVSLPYLDEPWIPYNEPIVADDHDMIRQDIEVVLEDYGALQKPIEYRIVADWIVATYFSDQFQAFPYIQFSGIINSGKSRMMKLLRWLSYRALLHASVSPSVLVREIDEFHPTELIDEVDTKFNKKMERGQDLFEVCLEGYTTGSSYTRCKQGEDHGVVRHDVYCPKAFAGRKIIDPALSSRCIHIPMCKTTPKIEELPETMPPLVQEIRSKLLGMKLTGTKLPIPKLELHGRIRELFTPIIAVEQFFGGDYSDVLEYAKKQEKGQEKEMASTLDADILGVIFYREMDDDEPNTVRTKRIAELTGEQSQMIGYRIKGMGIPVGRDNKSTFIDKDDPATISVLNELWKRHGIDVGQKTL